MIAYASNVQGPLIAQVYYPVRTPGSSVQWTLSKSAVGNDAILDSNKVCKNPPTIVAVHLGAPCQTVGVSAKYQVFTGGEPSAGWMTVAQLVYIKYTGHMGASPSPSPFYSDPTPGNLQLDTEFPPYGDYVSVSNGGNQTYTFVDSPYYKLTASHCTQVSATYDFEDFFL